MIQEKKEKEGKRIAGVYRLEITESEEKLKEMLGKQKTASDKERLGDSQ